MINTLLGAYVGSSAQIINLIPKVVIGIVAVLGIIGALKGLRRGISRQLVRTLTIVASGIISFILSTETFKKISEYLDGKTMADIEQLLIDKGVNFTLGDFTWLHHFDIHTLELILAIPFSVIIMPLIFVICFMAISAVMLIVHWILSAIFGFSKRRNNIITRLLGMGLGFIQGVAVAGLLLMPFIGLGASVSESVAVLNSESPEDEITVRVTETYDKYIKGAAESPAFMFLGKYGINALYTKIATVNIDDKPTDMTELLPDVAMIVSEARGLKGADFRNLSPENEATVKEVLDSVEDNAYLTEVLAGSVNALSHAYTSGAFNIEIGEPFGSIIDSAVTIFHTSDASNIHSDLDTIAEVLFILSRDDVLTAFDIGSDAMLDVLTKRDANGETTVNRVIKTINSNERTKPLVTLITKLSVTVMSQQAGISENAQATYDNIKASINKDILSIKKEDYATDEEYVTEVSCALDNTLKENNITLEKEIVDSMAQYVTDNYSDIDEITDEQVNDIILSYYDAYLDYLETGEIPDGIAPPVIE